jgi:hypothetical protein
MRTKLKLPSSSATRSAPNRPGTTNLSPRAEAERELARRIADKYCTRDGRILKQC